MRKNEIALLVFGVALFVIVYFYGRDALALTKKTIYDVSDYDELINNYAAHFGLDPLLIRAVIMQESSWRPDVMGYDGRSVGLMQITLPLAQDYFGHAVTFDDIAEPDINIHIGAWYLAKLMRRYNGDLNKALDGYNEGPGNVDKGRDISYSDSVLAYYRAYGGTA